MTAPRQPRQWNEGAYMPEDRPDVVDKRGVQWAWDCEEEAYAAYGRDEVCSWAKLFRLFGPLVEVLPETPQPPHEDWQPKRGERVIAKLFSRPDKDVEGEFVDHASNFVSRLNVGLPMWTPVLRATLRPAAPQSSPAPLLPLSAPVETEGQVEGVSGQLADHLVPVALAAGWRPPPCDCLPFDVCDTCWGPEQQRESQMQQLAYCEEVIPCGPEDADQCQNLREPGSVHCAQHQSSPLPADEPALLHRLSALFASTGRQHPAAWLADAATASEEGREWPVLADKPNYAQVDVYGYDGRFLYAGLLQARADGGWNVFHHTDSRHIPAVPVEPKETP